MTIFFSGSRSEPEVLATVSNSDDAEEEIPAATAANDEGDREGVQPLHGGHAQIQPREVCRAVRQQPETSRGWFCLLVG